MEDHLNCPICLLESPDFQLIDDTGDYGEQAICNCARCGKFMITRIASSVLKGQYDLNRYGLSAWIRNQNELNNTSPKITVSDGTLSEIIENLPNYTPSQKQYNLLKIIAKRSDYPGRNVLLIPRFDYTLAWARNEDELVFHTKSLIEKGYLEIFPNDNKDLQKETLATEVFLTTSGWEYIEENMKMSQAENSPQSRPSIINEEKDLQMKEYDIFISYASEDKAHFVRPLAHALRDYGLKVWYDEFALKIGARLRKSIDSGLASSRYGLVILSHNFFSKEWPQRELDAIFSIMKAEDRRILPVWYNLSAEEVKGYSPLLSDLLAANASDGVESVAKQVLDAINKACPYCGEGPIFINRSAGEAGCKKCKKSWLI